jgi:hypothetical protein
METTWEGRIAGVFKGYKSNRVYELSDGSRWRQEDRTDEYVYRERPTARLLWDQSIGRTFLDPEKLRAMSSWLTRSSPTNGLASRSW